MKKFKWFFLMSVVLVFAIPISVGAMDSDYSIYDESSCHSYGLLQDELLTEEEQFERLLELMSIAEMYNVYGIAPRSIANFPSYMPNILILTTNSYGRCETFGIGLYICVGDLTYGDRHGEEMRRLMETPIPAETVDFILDFAGIPHDNAVIFYSAIFRTPTRPTCKPLPEDWVCMWEGYNADTNAEPFVNRTIHMGELVLTHYSGGHATVGHPLNAAGTSFFTAFHMVHPPRTDVFINTISANTRVGHIMREAFTSTVDFAQVDVRGTNSVVSRRLPPSHNWPGGINITNFNGLAANGQAVRTIGGFGGVMDGTILNANANLSGVRFQQIVVTPDRGEDGDSGAALIRLNDSAVLGTKSGAVFYNGAWRMFFTNVRNYYS